ncbi:hypothetical protein AX16_006900 [Volvariella volvacea WC 439]|nr:hypothetical protein AX16_006900 [Volvariella volvacea WC 439]
MQKPTCTNVRIRSTQDAHLIFYAVQLGLLQMVTRRLDADERLALRSGCVYAWEERGPHTEITGLGIERFTEGRRWSPSRVRDEFLFYYEKYAPPPEAAQTGAEKQPPRDWDPLVKQTYSVWVETEKGRRKWHLTAYFTQATVDQLGTVDDIDGVRELKVPDGIFKSTRVGKNRGKTDDAQGRANDSKASTSVSRTYAPFPSPYPNASQTGSPSGSQPVALYEPYQKQSYSSYTPTGTPSPHFNVTPPLSSSQTILPSIQDYTMDSQRHTRSIPSPSQSHPEYNHGDMRSTLSSRPLDMSYNASHTNYLPPLSATTDSHYSQASSYAPSVLHPSSQTWYRDAMTPSTALHDVSESSYAGRPVDHSMSLHPISPTSQEHSNYAQPQHASYRDYQRSSPPQPQQPMYPLTQPQGIRDRRTPPMDDRRPHRPSILIPSSTASYEITSGHLTPLGEGRVGNIGPCRDLAPLPALTRTHPYRRDPLDDKTLRLLPLPPS